MIDYYWISFKTSSAYWLKNSEDNSLIGDITGYHPIIELLANILPGVCYNLVAAVSTILPATRHYTVWSTVSATRHLTVRRTVVAIEYSE